MDKRDNRTEKRKIGDIGESVACDYLVNKGFKIIGRNYLRKYGEIDIIAEKSGKIYFIEVKTVTRDVSYVTSSGRANDQYKPEDNVHPWKIKRLSRVIQAYILDKKLFDQEWQLDIVTVALNMSTRLARVSVLEDIIL